MTSCCGASNVRESSSIPKLKLPPAVLARLIKVVTSSGVPLSKVYKSGEIREKRLVFDKRLDRFTFLPSKKAFEARQISVDDIIDIQTAAADSERATPAKAGPAPVENSFVLHLRGGRSVTLISPDAEALDQVVELFAYLLRQRKVHMDENPHRSRLVSAWLRADVDGDGRLSFEEVAALLLALNLAVERPVLRRQFTEADRNGNGTLDFDEFCDFYDNLTLRPELRPLFDTFAARGADRQAMEPDELQLFLRQCQFNVVSVDVATQLCAALSDGRPVMSFSDFCCFLTSPTHNSCLKPSHFKLFEDMDRPLTQYALHGAVNFSTPADVQAALLAGCRYLDWPVTLGAKARPFVASAPDFPMDAFAKTVAAGAFMRSPYPMFIGLTGSWEAMQAAAAVLQTHVPRSALLTRTTLGSRPRYSPDSLRGRVIVLAFTDELDVVTEIRRHDVLGVLPTSTSRVTPGPSPQDGEQQDSQDKGRSPPTVIRLQRSSALSVTDDANCVVVDLTAAQRFSAAVAVGVNIAPIWRGTTNSAPHTTYFQLNGACGYRLLPARAQEVDPLALTSQPSLPPVNILRVRVLLGMQIPQAQRADLVRDIVDPYVELTLRGDARDESANPPARTMFVSDNGFNPCWNETFEFGLRFPERAFLCVKLIDYNLNSSHADIAEAALPVDSLRRGYHALGFRTVDGEPLPFTSLLCHLEKVSPGGIISPSTSTMIPSFGLTPSPSGQSNEGDRGGRNRSPRTDGPMAPADRQNRRPSTVATRPPSPGESELLGVPSIQCNTSAGTLRQEDSQPPTEPVGRDQDPPTSRDDECSNAFMPLAKQTTELPMETAPHDTGAIDNIVHISDTVTVDDPGEQLKAELTLDAASDRATTTTKAKQRRATKNQK
jgi:hypothetical protein